MSMIADRIEQRFDPLVSAWTAEVKRTLAPGISEPALTDNLPDLLRELIAALRRGAAHERSRASREHGRERHHLGLGLQELLREYGLLRAMIFNELEAARSSPPLGELRVLTDFFSVAITEAVREHRKLEKEQRELIEARLQLIVDAVPDLITFVDKDERYAMVNKAYEGWFGLPREQIPGRTVREIIGEPNYRHLGPIVGRALAGERVTWEIPFTFAGGRRGYSAGTFVPQRDPDGNVMGYVGLISDVSERRAEAAFEQQLIGIVSHDLKNPLQAILLNAAALARREDVTEGAARSVLRIRSSAERAMRMTADLLDLTRARHGGGLPVEKRMVDLRELSRGVIDEALAAFPDAEVRLETEGDTRGALDPDRVSQAAQNLITNALKYGAPTAPVRVTVRGGEGELLLEVHNEGAPIPPEQLPRLFDPFTRGLTAVDASGRSVGLGLFIVRKVAEAHGGSVNVASTPGEGTTFTLRLPR